jgi:Flp pilus assembly protein TadG
MAQKPMTTLNERRHDERGTTLIETMIACLILLIVVVGLLNLFTAAMTTNQQQGNLATRTTEYAQDKMEQLMALNFNDSTTNTTVYPIATTGGTGLTVGGSVPQFDPYVAVAPVNLYADYLDDTGNLLTAAQLAAGANFSYVRQWQIILVTPSLKSIRVAVTSNVPGVVQGQSPFTMVVCFKASGI